MERGSVGHLFPWGRRDCVTAGLNRYIRLSGCRLLDTDSASGRVLGGLVERMRT